MSTNNITTATQLEILGAELLRLKEQLLREQQETIYKGFLHFTKKEISKMQIEGKNYIIANDRLIPYRIRKDRNSRSMEARVMIGGKSVTASAKNEETLKNKIIKAIDKLFTEENDCPLLFNDFFNFYYQKHLERKKTERTIKTDLNRYKRHIQPFFGTINIKKISSLQCQELIDSIYEQGKSKTGEEVFSLLNVTFKGAMRYNIINQNPMDIVIKGVHERKNGKALSKDEERKLLEYFVNTPYQKVYAVLLYAGLRPNEYSTAKISDDHRFIVAVNSKRKGRAVEYKRIPITPKLQPYLSGVDNLEKCNIDVVRRKFKEFFESKHILYDLRTTFYTRCVEFCVDSFARDEFIGHSNGVLYKTYTDLSDEYLYKEGQKIDY